MPISFPSGAGRRLLIPLLVLSLAPAAIAQAPAGAVVQPLSRGDDPAELLAQALRTLASDPANLAALTAAGRNAVVLGDPNAAVGFFGRAQEIAPRDGRVKAGLGSALVQLEKPQDALRLFAEASRLGVPDADLAEDRGLAYDLTGQQALAQRDYRTVLAARPEDDVARRRLALSQGIAGDKAAAIATLDPLIRKRDIAGWRAQTFVLAMDGDAKGAGDITRIMLPQQSAMLQPFLVRLASLTPAEKARAVHFGEMPTTGRPYTPLQVASVQAPATYGAAPARAAAPRSDLAPLPRAAGVPVATAVASAPLSARAAPAATPTPVAAPAQAASVAVPPQAVVARAVDTASVAVPVVTPPQVAAIATPKVQAAPIAASAPLASIALTPEAPIVARTEPSTPITVAPPVASATSLATPAAPPTQVAQAQPSLAAAAPAAIPGLPMPASEGHYDLPHDAAMKSGARPARPVPPIMTKTIGTPIVHETPQTAPTRVAAEAETPAAKSEAVKPRVGALSNATLSKKAKPSQSEVAADEPPAARSSKPAKTDSATDDVPTTRRGKPAKAEIAATDDEPPTHKTRAPKSDTKVADDAAGSTKSKSATAATDGDCSPLTDKSAKAKKAKAAVTSRRCRELAAKDDETDATAVKSKSGKTNGTRSSRAKADADDADTPSSNRKSKAAEKPAAERVYVQVAGGANKDDLDKAWSGVKKKAPELMKGHKPLTTPLHATNRLLVGPFKDEDEAQAFVNKMAGKGLSGFTFKSGKGQKVEKIDTQQ